jgi:hypothetical protein
LEQCLPPKKCHRGRIPLGRVDYLS